jgi:hypothetical protein
VEASHLDGHKLQSSKIIAKLVTSYQELMQAETA